MANTSELPANDPVTPEQIEELIKEFEQYRERLVNETTSAAKKAKISQKKTMKELEPQLEEIDSRLELLRNQQKIMTTSTSNSSF